MKVDYELVGFVNLHCVYPAFIYPVFFSFSKYYFEDGNREIIDSFHEINETDLSEMIKVTHSLTHYHVGSQTLYAFAKGPKDIVCGNISFITQFLVDYKFMCGNALLVHEINEFLLSTKSFYQNANLTPFSVSFNFSNDSSLIVPPVSTLVPRFTTTANSDIALKEVTKAFNDLTIISHNYDEASSKSGFAIPLQILSSISWQKNAYHRYHKTESPRARRILQNLQRKYVKLVAKNNKLIRDFCTFAEMYASEISNSDTNEFIERMLLKKEWLVSQDMIRHLWERLSNDFPSYPMTSHQNSVNTLMRENETIAAENEALIKLINFLLDVLEDQGVSAPTKYICPGCWRTAPFFARGGLPAPRLALPCAFQISKLRVVPFYLLVMILGRKKATPADFRLARPYRPALLSYWINRFFIASIRLTTALWVLYPNLSAIS